MYNKNYSLSDWLKYLENLDKKVVFNLTQLKWIAKKLGVIPFKSFVFTVAGTNGKGTTCAVLERLLLDSGYTVGLYSSPHLINYAERIKINGCILDEEKHITSFKKIELVKDSILLTYFEFITLSALILFKKYKVDVVILEVGLGGRLDATNIIDSDISLITNIDIDHTFVLGKDRSSIAREKSGIFRKNRISVIGEENIPDSMYQVAKEKKTILKTINVDWSWQRNKNNWSFIHSHIKLYNLPITKIPLSNIAIALSSLYYANFHISEEIIRNSIPKVQLLGRFQKISNFPYIFLDVAHNPHASLRLSQQINEINVEGKIYAIVGIMKDKNIAGIIKPLRKKIDYWYGISLRTNRTSTLDQLRDVLPSINTALFSNIHDAWRELCKIVKKKDMIIIFGSFLTVSEFINNQNIHNKTKILNNIILENLC